VAEGEGTYRTGDVLDGLLAEIVKGQR